MKKNLRLMLLAIAMILTAWAVTRADAPEEIVGALQRFSLNTYTPAPSVQTAAPESIPEGSVRSTGKYSIILADLADLLSPEEEEGLMEVMKPLTEYGNVVFWTTSIAADDPLLALQQFVDHHIGRGRSIPSVAFAINMGSRHMDLLTRSAFIEQAVGLSEANAITDRHSSMATQ